MTGVNLNYRTLYALTGDHVSARLLRHLLFLWSIRGQRPYVWSRRSRTGYFTGASPHQQRQAEALLTDLGLVTIFKAGRPPTTCYIIHEQTLFVKAQNAGKRRKFSPPRQEKLTTALQRAKTSQERINRQKERKNQKVKTLTIHGSNANTLDNQQFSGRDEIEPPTTPTSQTLARQQDTANSSSNAQIVKIFTINQNLENERLMTEEGVEAPTTSMSQGVSPQGDTAESSSDAQIVKNLTICRLEKLPEMLEKPRLSKKESECGESIIINKREKREKKEEKEEKKERFLLSALAESKNLPAGVEILSCSAKESSSDRENQSTFDRPTDPTRIAHASESPMAERSSTSPAGQLSSAKEPTAQTAVNNLPSSTDEPVSFTAPMLDITALEGFDKPMSDKTPIESDNPPKRMSDQPRVKPGKTRGRAMADEQTGGRKKSWSLTERIIVSLPQPKFNPHVVRECPDPLREIEHRNAGRLTTNNREAIWYDHQPRDRQRVKFLDANDWARQFYRPQSLEAACRELEPYVPDPTPFRMITHFKDRQGDVWPINPYNPDVLRIEPTIRAVEEYIRHLNDLALVDEHLIHFDRDMLKRLLAATSMLELFEVVWAKYHHSPLPYRRLYLNANRKGHNTARAVGSLLEHYSPLFVAAVFDTYVTLPRHVDLMDWELRYLESEQYPIIYFCNRFERFAAIHEQRIKALSRVGPPGMTPLADYVLAVRAAVVSLRCELSRTCALRSLETEGN